jgi:hypothetical protein
VVYTKVDESAEIDEDDLESIESNDDGCLYRLATAAEKHRAKSQKQNNFYYFTMFTSRD